MNKETQQPKGTAFVEYWDTSAAKAAAAACQKARYCIFATLALATYCLCECLLCIRSMHCFLLLRAVACLKILH